MLAAEMVRVPRDIIPRTVPALRTYIEETIDAGDLLVTDAALKVAGLFTDPPRGAQWRPVLKGVARLAFATLPEALREMYGARTTPARDAAMRATLAAVRLVRPLLPPRYRYIAPYQEFRLGERGMDAPRLLPWSRRRMGIGSEP